jgi:PTH1 family peptidyl-tRNA hydrolase
MCSPGEGPEREPLLVVGLGNPGAGYRFSRHNAGFMILDRLALDLDLLFAAYGTLGWVARGSMEGGVYHLLKPATFMNRSGRAVGDLMDRHEIPFDRVLVVSDDFQLPLGLIRFRRKGSAGGHKGLGSIIRTLGTDCFPRLRVGIGPVPSNEDVIRFVLADFEPKELSSYQKVLPRASEAVRCWLEKGDIDFCMNRYNTKPDPGI